MGGTLMFLDVFLFEAQFFRGVEDEHFHADVGGDGLTGGFGDDDHQADGEGHGPDGGLLAEDAEQGVRLPEVVQCVKPGEEFAHGTLVRMARCWH